MKGLKLIVRFIRMLFATNFKSVKRGKNLAIAPGVKIYPSKFISFGNNVMVGRDVIISTSQSGGSPISIGDNVMIAHRTLIIGGNHEYSRTDIPINQQGEGRQAPIIIKEDVWIGANCIILSGITIGKGSIIGSGTVLTKSVPEYSIVVGNPGKVVKSRKE